VALGSMGVALGSMGAALGSMVAASCPIAICESAALGWGLLDAVFEVE
jgi:hypothetical protein